MAGQYLAYFLASPQAQKWMKERYVGTDMPRINVEHARSIPVPLPDLEEQEEIVRRVKGLLVLSDAAEQRVRKAFGKVDKLTHSVLAKAFRGVLVPTEAELARQDGRSYESGSELLARLTVSANGDTKRPRAKKSPKRRTKSGENLLEFMEG